MLDSPPKTEKTRLEANGRLSPSETLTELNESLKHVVDDVKCRRLRAVASRSGHLYRVGAHIVYEGYDQSCWFGSERVTGNRHSRELELRMETKTQ